MLIFCCLLAFGPYFCYDTPAALENEIESLFQISTTQYGYLYSVYAFPNLVLPLVGGVLYDKLGARKSMILFSSFSTLGQGVNTLAGYQENFKIYIVGQTLFGIGTESLYVG